MKKRTSRKLSLHRETLSTLTDRHLAPVAGGGQIAPIDDTQPASDTCWCAPTFWETCQG